VSHPPPRRSTVGSSQFGRKPDGSPPPSLGPAGPTKFAFPARSQRAWGPTHLPIGAGPDFLVPSPPPSPCPLNPSFSHRSTAALSTLLVQQDALGWTQGAPTLRKTGSSRRATGVLQCKQGHLRPPPGYGLRSGPLRSSPFWREAPLPRGEDPRWSFWPCRTTHNLPRRCGLISRAPKPVTLPAPRFT